MVDLDGTTGTLLHVHVDLHAVSLPVRSLVPTGAVMHDARADSTDSVLAEQDHGAIVNVIITYQKSQQPVLHVV